MPPRTPGSCGCKQSVYKDHLSIINVIIIYYVAFVYILYDVYILLKETKQTVRFRVRSFYPRVRAKLDPGRPGKGWSVFRHRGNVAGTGERATVIFAQCRRPNCRMVLAAFPEILIIDRGEETPEVS